MRGTNKNANTANPHTMGKVFIPVTICVPNLSMHPPIIPITIGSGSQRITFPIKPVTPKSNTITPAMTNAPAAS